MINGRKNLVKVVSEDVQDGDSDCSIFEQKVPKMLKPFYSVSDSDDDKKKNKQLSQLDGNGNGNACHSFSTIELNTSCVSSSTTGVEECREKISLPPTSSGPSFSDTTADDRCIGETLSELFPSNADSNTDIHFACTECSQTFATENGLSHHRAVFHGSEKDKECDLCSETFFSEDAVRVHKDHAHRKLLGKIDDNNVTQDVLNIAISISKKKG